VVAVARGPSTLSDNFTLALRGEAPSAGCLRRRPSRGSFFYPFASFPRFCPPRRSSRLFPSLAVPLVLPSYGTWGRPALVRGSSQSTGREGARKLEGGAKHVGRTGEHGWGRGKKKEGAHKEGAATECGERGGERRGSN